MCIDVHCDCARSGALPLHHKQRWTSRARLLLMADCAMKFASQLWTGDYYGASKGWQRPNPGRCSRVDFRGEFIERSRSWSFCFVLLLF